MCQSPALQTKKAGQKKGEAETLNLSHMMLVHSVYQFLKTATTDPKSTKRSSSFVCARKSWGTAAGVLSGSGGGSSVGGGVFSSVTPYSDLSEGDDA